jgi:hypothetical protein
MKKLRINALVLKIQLCEEISIVTTGILSRYVLN